MSEAGPNVRAFVALEMEPRIPEAIADLVARLRPLVRGARWIRAEGIHLTLRFLGSTSPERIERLRPALVAAAAACPPSSVSVSGLGTFPVRGSPRVLWLGVDLPTDVVALQSACEEAAAAAGFPRETRPFRAHLTLARFKERVPRPLLPEADLGRARVGPLVLFLSQTRPDGAVYTPLHRFDLGGEG